MVEIDPSINLDLLALCPYVLGRRREVRLGGLPEEDLWFGQPNTNDRFTYLNLLSPAAYLQGRNLDDAGNCYSSHY